MRSMTKDLGLRSHVRCLGGLQRSQGDRVEKRSGKARHKELKFCKAAGGDQIRKGEDEAGPRTATFSRPVDEGTIAERDLMSASED